MVGPAQVELVYELPFESFTKYSTSAIYIVQELVRTTVTLVGELTWYELKTMLSLGVGPQYVEEGHPKTPW
jgi:hypothetical protein